LFQRFRWNSIEFSKVTIHHHPQTAYGVDTTYDEIIRYDQGFLRNHLERIQWTHMQYKSPKESLEEWNLTI